MATEKGSSVYNWKENILERVARSSLELALLHVSDTNIRGEIFKKI
jgi:hypothetical protein